MRLDKFLVSTGKISRSDAGRACRGGKVTVNGTVEKRADRAIAPETDIVTLYGERIVYRPFTYILLNKPDGVVSATEDGREQTVLDLLPDELRRIGLFPCGRLDKHTLGLVLLTNNGPLGHRLLSPRHHVEKRYVYTCRSPLSEDDRLLLERGVTLDDGYTTKPARIKASEDGLSGEITLIEGKYHQIKRMLEAVDNKIVTLERVSFGPLTLDETLGRGEWRYLSDDEVAALERAERGEETPC
ncbi:MAG: rRNA pseudouridine synthase [Clostridia bacterium]|nr:rRNA pseudouridine synthase [Clostridia bacterium]